MIVDLRIRNKNELNHKSHKASTERFENDENDNGSQIYLYKKKKTFQRYIDQTILITY